MSKVGNNDRWKYLFVAILSGFWMTLPFFSEGILNLFKQKNADIADLEIAFNIDEDISY